MLMSIKELVKELNSSTQIIRKLAETGKLKYTLTAGGDRRFSLEDAKEALKLKALSEDVISGYVPIGVICKEFGVHPHTVRNWEKYGWISSVRNKNGHRRFDLEQVKKEIASRRK